ncbi:RNA polymerase sigma-70 factor [Flavobacteriaceae bacterium XHP0103]|nr:RNA polymerase sigma-70 factor [Marixanthotalea marina]
MDNEELVQALREGDELAFDFLFKCYYKPLLAFITTYTRNVEQAEDIVQQSFISLWNKKEDLKLKVSPKNYLYTIAYNQFVDHYRKSVRKSDFLEELRLAFLRDSIDEDDELLEKRISKLKAIIEKLPPKCKKILIMSRQQGLKYKEIADKLNISHRTVEEQVRIAFKKIRKAFEEE